MGTTSFSGPVESIGGFTVGGVPVQGGSPAQQLTASNAVFPTTKVLELNHATVAIAATLIQGPAGFFAVVDTSASGTAAHTVTLTNGTWNGTNKVLTVNAPGEAALIYFDTQGRGTVITNTLNTGTNVTFSG
jgi:hypothetical protein